MRIISIILIIIVGLSLFSINSLATGENQYITLEGKLNLVGSEPFVNLILISNNDEVYSLSGDLTTELRKLFNGIVRITGSASEATVPRTSGDINVKEYTLIKPEYNQEVEWALGKIYNAKDGFILIDQNQIIYLLINGSELNLSNYVNAKVLLIGDVEFHGDFYAKMKIEGYKLLSEN